MAKSTLFLSIKARYLQTYPTFQGNGLLKTSLVKSVDFGYLINLKFYKPSLAAPMPKTIIWLPLKRCDA